MSDPIRTSPLLEWPASQRDLVTLSVTVPEGRTLADWDAVTLRVREDPLWPRQGADLYAVLDPEGGGWPAVLEVAGTPTGDTTATFDVTVPAGVGRRRYVLSVVGTGGTAGRVPLFKPTWLSVTPGGG